MEENIKKNRNFNSISPSAKSLILQKGFTKIPFARRTAELLMAPEEYKPDFTKTEMSFWARVVHFESRYLSISHLLEDLKIRNILEVSSGFSFRGLEMITRSNYYYIDTDLPEVIEIKNEFSKVLKNTAGELLGNLELLPLNCLDEKQFQEVVDHFPKGEIVIVNEGMLMYLDLAEKEKLCRIIHKILRERGGYWITADIYRKSQQKSDVIKIDDSTKEFFSKHNIEENKFESFDEAKLFFKKMGFEIDMIADLKRSEISSFKYFLDTVSCIQLLKMKKSGKMQETWRLKLSDSPAT